MIILIDIGNTLTKIAIGSRKKQHIKILKPKIETNCSDWIEKVKQLFEKKINSITYHGAIISSVVPSKTNLMIKFIKSELMLEPIVVNSKLIPKLPIKIDLNNQQIGSDFLAIAVGASQYYGDCVVISLGTATTYTIVQNHEFIGAVIGPGFTNTKQALVSNAALIESFNLHHFTSLIGKTTNHALSVGFGYGFDFMIASTLNGIKTELKITEQTDFKVIITGGAFEELAPFLTFNHCQNQEILMYGLLIIYHHLIVQS